MATQTISPDPAEDFAKEDDNPVGYGVNGASPLPDARRLVPGLPMR